MKRGLRYAVDYLESFYPIELISDDLHKRIGADIKYDTLAHSLRRTARAGQVSVIYKPDNNGIRLAYYKGKPKEGQSERAPESMPVAKVEEPKAQVQAPSFPAVFFYELLDKPGEYSPYYTSPEALELAVDHKFAIHVYTGSHEAPISVSGHGQALK